MLNVFCFLFATLRIQRKIINVFSLIFVDLRKCLSFLKNHQFVIQFCLVYFIESFCFCLTVIEEILEINKIFQEIFFMLLFKDIDLFWCLSFSLYFQNFNDFLNCSSVHIKVQINCFLNEDYIKNIWSERSRNENS